ncbi:MAG: MFS transporter [Usitatibacteraceae bacterium]
MALPHSLRSLRHQNFRRYYIGQSVSQLGSWMQSTAVLWLAYRLTGSAAATGMIGFLAMVPYIFVTPLAGALSDRVSRRKVLLTVLSISVVVATILAALTYTQHMTITLLGVLALSQGILNGVEVPTRHAFFVQLIVNKDDLPNAIALNSININSTRLIGPAIGGLLIAAFGETACFALNALSFLAVLIQLQRITPNEGKRKENTAGLIADLIEGWRFGMTHPVIRPLVLTIAAISFAVSPYTVLMPAIVVQSFGKGAELNGLFISCVGLGALTGAILLARRPNVRGLTSWLLMTGSLAAVGILGFSFSQNEWLSFLCMAITGMGLMGSSVAVNTIVQSIVEDDMRGRVVSIYSTFFIGSAPLGHLAAGWLAEHIGAARAFTVCGVMCALAVAGYALYLPRLRAHLRPIYLKRGIIPATPGATEQ